jgi:hypothetical protein
MKIILKIMKTVGENRQKSPTLLWPLLKIKVGKMVKKWAENYKKHSLFLFSVGEK